LKILVGLSGGVDSTVSAYLLQKMGYEVEGVYMKLHNLIDGYHEKNIENVKKVANYLGIKYHIADFSNEFKNIVYDYFVDDYIKGLTPNPCVVCNRFIKFGKMYQLAKELGIEKIATGHYAIIKNGYIYKGKDNNKDQSYFISWIDKSMLDSIVFPLGEMEKTEVKEIARGIDVLKSIADGKESSEVCFVENTYIDILKNHTNIDKEGKVLSKDGETIGIHKGYMHYTVGKRKGFTIQNKQPNSVPQYVTNIDAKSNTVTVAPKEEVYEKYFEARDLNMFIDSTSFECSVKIRYRTKPAKCKVTIVNDIAKVELQEEVFGIARGQIAVFYDDEKVIASGWII
jgi:tRNA-specific 2-thiouridylase